MFQVIGNQALRPDEPVGVSGLIRLRKEGAFIEVPYQNDDTVAEVIERINDSGAEISVHIGHGNRLVIKATADGPEPFTMDYLEDTGSFLVGLSGVLGASNVPFQYDVAGSTSAFVGEAEVLRAAMINPSAWMRLRSDIQEDANLVAAAAGQDYDGVPGDEVSNGIGDGNIALDIASLRHASFMFDKQRTFNEFYVHMVEHIGSQAAVAQVESDKYGAIVSNLETLQQAVAGVNIDEEMAHMISMQHGYRASAKLVSVIDEMLNTLINTMI